MLQRAGMSDADALNRDRAGWRSSSIALAGLTVLLGACSGGGGSGSGGASLPAATGKLTVSDCVIPLGDSAWDGTLCRTYAVRSVARAPTPFSESGAAVTLEVVVYTPVGTGPFPAVVFHHGSTGNGDDPTLFSVTYTSESIARFFAERALQDAEATAAYVASRDDVDATRMISAGTSRTFYSLSHSRANFDAFVGAGGRGSFEIFARAPTLNGHFLVNNPALWSATLETFVS